MNTSLQTFFKINRSKLLKIYLIIMILPLLTILVMLPTNFDKITHEDVFLMIVFILGLPLFILSLTLLDGLISLLSYKRKIYKYENEILMHGFVKYIENKDYSFDFSFLSYKYERDNDIIVYLKVKKSIHTRNGNSPYLLFSAKDEKMKEKLFYFFRNKLKENNKYDIFFDETRYYLDIQNDLSKLDNIIIEAKEFDIEIEKVFNK